MTNDCYCTWDTEFNEFVVDPDCPLHGKQRKEGYKMKSIQKIAKEICNPLVTVKSKFLPNKIERQRTLADVDLVKRIVKAIYNQIEQDAKIVLSFNEEDCGKGSHRVIADTIRNRGWR